MSEHYPAKLNKLLKDINAIQNKFAQKLSNTIIGGDTKLDEVKSEEELKDELFDELYDVLWINEPQLNKKHKSIFDAEVDALVDIVYGWIELRTKEVGEFKLIQQEIINTFIHDESAILRAVLRYESPMEGLPQLPQLPLELRKGVESFRSPLAFTNESTSSPEDDCLIQCKSLMSSGKHAMIFTATSNDQAITDTDIRLSIGVMRPISPSLAANTPICTKLHENPFQKSRIVIENLYKETTGIIHSVMYNARKDVSSVDKHDWEQSFQLMSCKETNYIVRGKFVLDLTKDNGTLTLYHKKKEVAKIEGLCGPFVWSVRAPKNVIVDIKRAPIAPRR